MTFDELICLRPKIKLAEVIQLFLLGYDDKIYINIECGEGNTILEDVRIIDGSLVEYYDYYVEYFADTCDKGLFTIGIKLKEE